MSTTGPARFAFVKLTVADIDAATAFFEKGFDLTHADTVDTPGFREHMMTGAQGATTIVLFHWKDGRAIETGNGYGPIGMISRDLDADLARALAAGATQKGETVNFGPARIAFVHTPEGHEVEIMQMGEAAPAA
ncbi:VOC family protein [Qipengyuania sp. JC766]|uniref:VOC family protein n=1 Tax=Qipengyuania sp. JC766 TaxID=3232139 RepID=UPI0034574D15